MKMLRKYWWIIAGPFIIIVLVVTVIRIGTPGFGQSTREVCEASSQQTSPSSSTMIFYNGVILTMDDAQPQAQAMVIKGDRLVAVGSNEDILVLADSATQVVDLEGKTVVPGFIDSHEHRIGLQPDEAGQPAGRDSRCNRTGLDEYR